jgi:ribosomal protein L40E
MSGRQKITGPCTMPNCDRDAMTRFMGQLVCPRCYHRKRWQRLHRGRPLRTRRSKEEIEAERNRPRKNLPKPLPGVLCPCGKQATLHKNRSPVCMTCYARAYQRRRRTKIAPMSTIEPTALCPCGSAATNDGLCARHDHHRRLAAYHQQRKRATKAKQVVAKTPFPTAGLEGSESTVSEFRVYLVNRPDDRGRVDFASAKHVLVRTVTNHMTPESSLNSLV